MKQSMKRLASMILATLFLIAIIFGLTGCRQSRRVAWNVSKEADSFNVTRKLTVLNVRSDKVLLELTGTFAIANNAANELEVICKTGEEEYKKHFVYLNSWTVYTVEDISGADVDPYKYEITFYPQMIPVADFDVEVG